MFRTLLLIMLVISSSLVAQTLATKTSNPAPLLDQNENLITFSYGQEVTSGQIVFFKLKNGYTEPVTIHISYSFLDSQGVGSMGTIQYDCMKPNEENIAVTQNVKTIVGLYLTKFHPCNANTTLSKFSITDTLNLFKKQNVAANGNSKKINTKGDIITYKGTKEEIVTIFLSKFTGWSTSSDLYSNDGVPPVIPTDKLCQRDQYVNGGVLYAWAAESYFRLGENLKSSEAAEKASEMYLAAMSLCSNSTGLMSGECKTEKSIPCNSQAASLSMSTSPGQSGDNYDTRMNQLGQYLMSSISMISNPSKENYINFFKNSGVMLSDGNKELISAINKVSSSLGTGSTGLTSSTNLLSTPYQQLDAQSKLQVDNAIRDVATTGVDLYFDNKERKTISRRSEEKINRDKNLKIRFGYSIQDLEFSIKSFDNSLLDKIISSGIPLSLPLYRPKTEDTYADWISKDDVLEKPIHLAAQIGNSYAITQLVSKGVDINGYSLHGPPVSVP